MENKLESQRYSSVNLQTEYYKEAGIECVNSQGEFTNDYVQWLEKQISDLKEPIKQEGMDEKCIEFGDWIIKEGYEIDSTDDTWYNNKEVEIHGSMTTKELYHLMFKVQAVPSEVKEGEKEIIREMFMRANLGFPENEQDEKWFNETFASDSGRDLLRKTMLLLGLGNDETAPIEKQKD